MAKLIIESGAESGAIHPLDHKITTVGRSVTNTIQIVDKRMSRNHLEIHNSGGTLTLRDLGSKNGTLLNGQPAVEPIELHHNDRIQVGDTVFRIEIETIPGSPGSQTGDPDTDETGRNSPFESSGVIHLVEEEQDWGSARSERRAGYNPVEQTIGSATLQDLKSPNRRLEILYEITDAIRSVFSLEELLDRIMGIVQIVVRPDRTFLLLVNEESGELIPSVIKTRDGRPAGEVRISSSIVGRSIQEGISLLVSDAAQDDRFSSSESIISSAIRTAMVAPLIFKEKSIGVIYADSQSRPLPFNDDELDMLTSIANQASVAITNARLQAQILEQHKLAREMEIARNIQTNLLPKTYPDLPGYQISAMSLPAKHVGGDYYDFVSLPDGRAGFAVADVSGKGVPAAILTATTRSYLQSETQHKGSTLAQTVARMNSMVHRDVTNDMYVTMVLAALDHEQGSIEYVNAGHSHPFILHPRGTMDFLDTGGLFLGIDDSLQYSSGEAYLPPGGLLVLYTDGVTDIQNAAGEVFGEERFYEIISEKRYLSAEEIRNAVYQACIRHRGNTDQFDDFTLIVIKRLDFNESELD